MPNKPLPQAIDVLSNARTSSNVFLTLLESRDPTQFDVAYAVTQRWVNTVDFKEWILKGFSNQVTLSNPYGQTVANWILISNANVELIYLTGNTGGQVGATNNNINIVGDGIGIMVTGNPVTSTLTLSLIGSGEAIESFTTDVSGPVTPNAFGVVAFTGATNIYSNGSIANTMNLNLQGTNHALFVGRGTQTPSASLAVGTNGQFLIGSTAADPVFATPTATTVAAGSTPIAYIGGAGSSALQLQIAQAIASTNASNVGVAAFNSSQFSVDANGFVTITSAPPSVDLHVAQIIVGNTAKGANFSTLSAAMSSAVSGQTIFIQPGTYSIGTQAWTSGVDICAFDCDALNPNVTLSGTLTYSSSGSVSASGIQFATNSSNILQMSGSAASVVNFVNCYFNCSNATGITNSCSNSSSAINLIGCSGNLGTTGIGLISQTGASAFLASRLNFTNTGGSTTGDSFSGGSCNYLFSQLLHPVATSSSASGGFNFVKIDTGSQNVTSLTLNGTTHSVDACILTSLAASTISVGSSASANISATIINSTATNVITGSGSITLSDVSFVGTSAGVNTTTQKISPSFNSFPRTATSTTPYTVLSTDQFISIDTSAGAKQVNLPNSSNTNQWFIIKDRTGHASSNNITVTTSGGSVLIDAATTFVINSNYGSAQFLFNGTSYEVF